MSKATDNTMPAWAQQLNDRLDRIERAATPKLESELRRAAEDEVWFRTRAIAELADPAERVRAMLALDPSAAKRCWQHMTPAVALATARAAKGSDQHRLMMSCPQGLKDAMLVSSLPPPARVRLRLKDDVASWSSPRTRGARRGDDMEAINLLGERYAGTEVGVVQVDYLRSTYEARLKIDPILAQAVEAGIVIVEAVSDDESRRMLASEIQSLAPAERPTLTL